MPLLLLDPYVDVILALALAWLSLKIVQSLFGPIEFIPGIAAAERKISQSVSHACGEIANGVSHAVGSSLHAVARLIGHPFATLKRVGTALVQVSALAAALALAYHGIRSLVHRLEQVAHAGNAGVKRLEKEYHGIEHRVRELEHKLARGIGHDLRLQIKALERELHRVERRVIPGIRSAADAAEADARRALNEVESIPFPSTVKTWAAAIAVGISALGLDWLRCNSNPFNNNRNACGLWNDLAALLGLATAVLAVEDFEAMIREMQSIEGAIIDEAESLFGLK